MDVVNQDSHPDEEVYVNVISDNSDSNFIPTSSKTRIRPKNKQNPRCVKKVTTSSITGHNLIKSCTIIKNAVNDVSYSENASFITEDNSVEKPKLTVFGDSMIRNTGEILTKNLPNMDTIVLSHPGLKIHQATQQVEHIFQRHTKKDIIVLQVGSNDVPYEDTKAILNKYNHLISTVRSNAPDSKLLIMAVPYRLGTDSVSLNKKVDMLNIQLQQQCAKEKLLFYVDANPQLAASNYHTDGLHYISFNGRLFYSSNYIAHSANFHPIRITENL